MSLCKDFCILLEESNLLIYWTLQPGQKLTEYGQKKFDWVSQLTPFNKMFFMKEQKNKCQEDCGQNDVSQRYLFLCVVTKSQSTHCLEAPLIPTANLFKNKRHRLFYQEDMFQLPAEAEAVVVLRDFSLRHSHLLKPPSSMCSYQTYSYYIFPTVVKTANKQILKLASAPTKMSRRSWVNDASMYVSNVFELAHCMWSGERARDCVTSRTTDS